MLISFLTDAAVRSCAHAVQPRNGGDVFRYSRRLWVLDLVPVDEEEGFVVCGTAEGRDGLAGSRLGQGEPKL
jgi:hypothetical protein